ncbi:YaiI/YqxD family protein [Diplocloster hominis]|uniref:YaiI/YqxD family protein n=1 Tax=Diplocloster hominis TaxID=3079010 RepID=UPI0031BBB293
MKILIDADACPVVGITEKIARERGIPVWVLCDTSHVIQSKTAEVFVIDQGADAVDFALIQKTVRGDVVVTQDYGVAVMALGKGAHPIHQSGKWYTNENIDAMLMERHLAKQARRASRKNHLKGPSKRSGEDDEHFAESLIRLLDQLADT